MVNVIGAILIGGRSTRMGRDKATLRLRDGRTMVEHVAVALRAVCSDVVAVGASGSCQAGGEALEAIADVRAAAGPLGGIEALLMSNRAAEYLVCACDVPAVTPEILRMLLGEAGRRGAEGSAAARRHAESLATVLRVRGREHFEPLPARVSAGALPTVQRLLDDGERSLWRTMEELGAMEVEIDEATAAAALRNVNTPDDLSRL